MELLKRRKSPQEDPRVDWSEERSIFKVLEHSKIIGARKFAKNKMDHAKTNFRVFLAYEALRKIVWDTKIWRAEYHKLIWPF